jgi:hypothetical protein
MFLFLEDAWMKILELSSEDAINWGGLKKIDRRRKGLRKVGSLSITSITTNQPHFASQLSHCGMASCLPQLFLFFQFPNPTDGGEERRSEEFHRASGMDDGVEASW